jgi:hypothetical protein
MKESLLPKARVVDQRVIGRFSEYHIFKVIGKVVNIGITVVCEIVEGRMAEECCLTFSLRLK